MTPVQTMVASAKSRVGQRYVLGARAVYSQASYAGPWDCAELVTWAAYQATGKMYGVTPSGDAYSGAWASEPAVRIAADVAANTYGAILIRAPGAAGQVGHVAISMGAGDTVEAHSTKRGVIVSSAIGRRWDLGLLLPGLVYEVRPAMMLYPPRVWRIGTSGPKVEALQARLTALGYQPGPVDGVYGQRTAEAVRDYQLSAGLVPDGEAGPVTLAALAL